MAKNSPEYQLQQILKNGYGVRSGVYSAVDSRITMKLDSFGEYQPIFPKDISSVPFTKLLQVDMMSEQTENEDTLSSDLFSKVKGIQHDPILGYYLDLYAGHVVEGDFRSNGSSGGFTSWILAELLASKEVEYVIHAVAVDPDVNDGVLFKYTISNTVSGIKNGAKSRYYPLELSEVLHQLKTQPGSYAVVGIPEFITELRLLSLVDPDVKNRIKYTIGLVCGHQKTAKYADALAWQQGIKPGDLKAVDFRIKQPNKTAYEYLQSFTGTVGDKTTTVVKSHDELLVDDWALGYFKSSFSDYTDNSFNETADIVLGDAWLDEYNADGMGTNILIVRNPVLASIIKKALKSGRVVADAVSVDTIKRSQSGLIHHTRDELPYRLHAQRQKGIWVPIKRTNPSIDLPRVRKKVQNLRLEAVWLSKTWYKKAEKNTDWLYFETRIKTLIKKYEALYALDETDNENFINRVRIKLRVKTRLKNGARKLKHATRVRTRLRSVKHAAKSYIDDVQSAHKSDGLIVSLPGNYNYGNIIQKFALQRFLSQHGKTFQVLDLPRIIDDSSAAIYGDMINFTNTYIKPIAYKENGTYLYKNYIVGSDQVWRDWYGKESNMLLLYFLGFVKSKKANKISYAASFGVDTLRDADYFENTTQDIKPLLNDFSAVSVREVSGIKLVEELRGTTKPAVKNVIDPTLLLDAKVYSELIDSNKKVAKGTVPSVYCYVLDTDASKTQLIKKLAAGFDGGYKVHTPKENEKHLPVEEWLKGFRDAEFVVTDSFHGTVFSIINKSPFVVFANTHRGLTRMENLLDSVGISRDRLIFPKDIKTFDVSKLEPIDWDAVYKRLNTLREDSAEWLLSNLK